MIVLVTAVGQAGGARAVAAALACAGADAERASLLIEVDSARRTRPTVVATTAARTMEERLAAHLPEVGVAARGRICQLALSDNGDERRASIDQIAAALPLAREALAVLRLPPARFQEAIAEPRIRPSGTLLRADLAVDHALTALAVGDLMKRGVEVVVAKRPLPRLAGYIALLGALPAGSSALPACAGRLLP
ncbi:MAG TPA: hypothetical protein VFY04_07845 [Solirubrobacterales bacterium]|nr:hypothetical protein [Solirubrobacterales bacterium]